MIPLRDAQTFNAAAFVLHNDLVNENGNKLEFSKHHFLLEPYMDNSPMQVIRKASQVGWSTLAIIRAFHLANYIKANVIYTLPSKSIVKDFVTPKVDPIVENNPTLKAMVGDVDSMGLKQIGERFVYFRSSWDEASGIAISAHVLISDELDRSNQKAVKTYRTRLDSAKLDRPELGWEWQFSNPTIPGYGVDEKWELSDQKRWMIKPKCGHWQELTWPENIDFDKRQYICKQCKKILTDNDRINGQWVRTYMGREVSGYWINQLMCPWHSADKIIRDSEGDPSVFHNFTLGLPYQAKDQSVGRTDIIKCLNPDTNPRIGNAMGVDNGVVKTFVVGNKYGIFRIGQTESWEEIENMRNQYDATMVIDANPYPNTPKKLVQKYRGKVYIAYYKEDSKQIGVIRYGESDKRGVVYLDRTKIIDDVVADLMAKDVEFNLTATDLEEYIRHWGHLYRVIEETEKGMRKPVWMRMEGKPADFPHAHVYFKAALSRAMIDSAIVRTPSGPTPKPMPVIQQGRQDALDIKGVIARANKKKKSWKTI